MNIDLLTIKMAILLFVGMIGVISFQYCIYQKKELNVPEFLMYSTVLSLLSYLFQFKKLLTFLNDKENINIDLKFLILGLITSTLISVILAKFINSGLILKILKLNHFGKTPLVEAIYLNKKYKDFLSYYSNIRTDKFIYTGSIESINSKENYVEFLISNVDVYKIIPNAPPEEFNSFRSIYLSLEEGTFNIEFYNN